MPTLQNRTPRTYSQLWLLGCLTALLAFTSGVWAQNTQAFSSSFKAQAPQEASMDAKAKKSVKKRKSQRAPKVATTGGESTAERNARLTRECKGRPNAGACEGFAR